MGKLYKKVISLLLVITIVFSLTPYAFADKEDNEDNEEQNIEESVGPQKIGGGPSHFTIKKITESTDFTEDDVDALFAKADELDEENNTRSAIMDLCSFVVSLFPLSYDVSVGVTSLSLIENPDNYVKGVYRYCATARAYLKKHDKVRTIQKFKMIEVYAQIIPDGAPYIDYQY